MLPFTGDQAFTWGMGDIVRVKIAHVGKQLSIQIGQSWAVNRLNK